MATTEARKTGVEPPRPPDGDPSMGFSLNFLSGRGLLSVRDRRSGPFEVRLLEMEIPDISFPFDVTGGAERFKNRRCSLRHLVYGLDIEGFQEVLKRADLVGAGFVDIKIAIRDGFIEVVGRFAVGEHQADFTFRAALLLRSREEVAAVFYDTRVYGWLPVPSALLPVYLRRALDLPFVKDDTAGQWLLRPGEQFLRSMLPKNGWKIPDMRQAGLVAAEASRGKVVFVCGPEGDPDSRQLIERAPPVDAVRAAEGIAQLEQAERALGRGQIHEAYDKFREALDDERGGPWARTRLIQIGAADPELAVDTRQLAEEVLARDPKNAQALLALATIAMRDKSFGEAAARYTALADIARADRSRYDSIAAELAAAQANAPIDPGGALAAYERAAARARDSIVAHRALFELRAVQGDWQGASQAGERLLKLEDEPKRKAVIHRELGALCRNQLNDLKRARLHFERALRIAPDDPGALEGLAETYAARGEPARAASYLARLAEQAEKSGDQKRIASLNLRLGEIWERWLGDTENAAARYRRVLDADPNHRTAQLRLAELAELRGDLAEARALYENILASEEDSGDPGAHVELAATYVRLARVTLAAGGAVAEAIASLERAVELDSGNRAARDDLARLLRERGEWSKLLELLEQSSQLDLGSEEIRLSLVHAARIEIEQRRDLDAGRAHLEQALAQAPDHREALDLLVPILDKQNERQALAQRLSAAAHATTEPMRKADLLFRLAETRGSLGLGVGARAEALTSALDVNPYHMSAALALVQLFDGSNDHERMADALERVAIASADTEQRVDALLQRASLLLTKLKRPDEAEQALRDTVALDPGNAKAQLELAKILEARGDEDGARQILLSAAADPRVSKQRRGVIHQRLAEMAAAGGDTDEEIVQLTRAVEHGVRDEAVTARLTQALTAGGRSRELADLMESWAGSRDAADPDVPSLWMRAAEIRRTLGELPRARDILLKLVDRGGATALTAALQLENIAWEARDFTAAARAIEQQIGATKKEAQPPLYDRLIEAHISANDLYAAEQACLRLIDIKTGAAKARRFLCQRAETAGDYEAAMHHLTALLGQKPESEAERTARREAWVRAAAIAHEIRPKQVDVLTKSFLAEFPREGDDALSQSLGDLLAKDNRWEDLLALRNRQLASASGAQALQYRREIGLALHRHLGRSAEAAAHFEEILAAAPGDGEAAAALAGIYETTGKTRELGALLISMCERAASFKDAVGHALRAAELQDDDGAAKVLRTVAARRDLDPNDELFLEALREHGLLTELAQLRQKSLDFDFSVEDGRFADLVQLLAGPLDQPDAAVKLCEHAIDVEGAVDLPWRTLVDLCDQHPDAGDASNVLHRWADAREGEPRAALQLELAGRHKAEGDATAAKTALFAAAGAAPDSAAVVKALDAAGGATVLEAAATLARSEELAAARKLYDRAIAKTEDAAAIMEQAAAALTDAGQRAELGRWRLGWSKSRKGADALVLRLHGYADLVAEGQVKDPALVDIEVDLELAMVKMSDARQAAAAFAAARAAGLDDWVERAAAALEKSLPEDAPALREVLHVRVERELAADPKKAVKLAKRLVQLGDPKGEDYLEQALAGTGEIDELITHVRSRAEEASDEEAPALWARLAGLYVRRERWREAALALETVPEGSRTEAWGKQRYETGKGLNDPKMKVEGAKLCAEHQQSSALKAEWLRSAARTLWWELSSRDEGKQLLSQAHELDPIDGEAIHTDAQLFISQKNLGEARKLLEEGLAVLRGVEAGRLLLDLAELCMHAGDAEAGGRALRSAKAVLGNDAALTAELARVAVKLGQHDLALEALATAFKLDANTHETAYLAALEENGQFDVAVKVLVARAEELTGADAAPRWARAGRLSRDMLTDRDRALDLLGRATRLTPTPELLEETYVLACELNKLTVIAALGPPLLKRVAADSPKRNLFLRPLVDALDHLSLAADSLPYRQELLTRGEASYKDKAFLGRGALETNAAEGAKLLEEAARGAGGDERNELLIETAAAWVQAKDVPRAKRVLDFALGNGADTVEAHTLALQILEGPARQKSGEALLAMSGDASWPAERRAQLRFDVARGKMDANDAEGARQLLKEAGDLHKPAGWAELLEQALLVLDRKDEVAQLWLAEAASGHAAWSPSDMGDRLSDAADIFAGAGEPAAELECLELLSRLRPADPKVQERLANAAVQIGDADKFIALVGKQLENASDPAARSELALRYAAMLESHFTNAEAALTLLSDAFNLGPTGALAQALKKLLEAQGRGDELVKMIEDAADAADPKERAGLLSTAASMVESQPERAFALYRQVVELDAGDERARTFSLQYAEKKELWEDLVELLALAARGNETASYEMAMRGSVVAREKLQDPARESKLLARAVELQPRDVNASLRLMELQTGAGDLEGAMTTLFASKGSHQRQIDVASKLAAALREAKRPADAVKVMDWLATNHPQSLAASDHRIDRARAASDDATLLVELVARLAHPAMFDDAERAPLHLEAARAAVRTGDRVGALAHFTGALKGGAELEVEELYEATVIADEAADTASGERLVKGAVKRKDAIAEAADGAAPAEQPGWLAFSGRVFAAAGDKDRAIEAHGEAVVRSPGMPPAASVEALRRHYEQKGDWQALLNIYTKLAANTEGAQRADLLYSSGVLLRDRLLDEAKANEAFAACLETVPDHPGGQLARGMMLAAQKKYAEALPLLSSRVNLSSEGTPRESLTALMESLRETGDAYRALEVVEVMQLRFPEDADLHARRAELLETLGRQDESQAAWAAYAQAASERGNPDELAPVRRRLALAARDRGDLGTAIYEMSEALRLKPEWLEVGAELRAMHEQVGQWAESAALRETEAAATPPGAERVGRYRELGRIYREELNDPTRAAAALDKALAGAPDDAGLLMELLALQERNGDWAKFLQIGERMLAVVAEPDLPVDLFARLARAYQEGIGDPSKAKELYSKAASKQPGNEALKAKHRELARLTGDFATWAAAEEEALAALADGDERFARYQELSEVYMKNLGDLAKATAALEAANKARPGDAGVLRQLADISALDADSYERAAALYTELLSITPLELDVIRIRARLAGQMNDTDRAYGMYAALLALVPTDEEALEYVQACRGARPRAPQRALTDADRVGLIHPDQIGALEDLYAPLARFAELTQQGDLARRGVGGDERLVPEDERVAWMTPTLEAVGLADAAIFEWRAGGYACETELVGGTAAFLLGGPLAQAPNRQRTFLVVRAAELFRTGHTLCEKLSDYDLGGLVAALCLAIEPNAQPPGAMSQTDGWAIGIGAPMTDEIRAQIAPKVLGYLSAAASLDLGKWRRGCVSTAARLALTVTCDIAEALDALMRMRGFEDLTAEQRLAVLQESAEDQDLLRFAMSDAYYEARQALGLALRRQG